MKPFTITVGENVIFRCNAENRRFAFFKLIEAFDKIPTGIAWEILEGAKITIHLDCGGRVSMVFTDWHKCAKQTYPNHWYDNRALLDVVRDYKYQLNIPTTSTIAGIA